MDTRRYLLLPLISALAVLVLGQVASATTSYPVPIVGTSVTFSGIQETTQSAGDPAALFGAPIGVGDQLVFFPTAFTASANGASGFDETSSQLQLMITGNGPGDVIDEFFIQEYGDVNLVGTGTAATGTFIGISGFLTVLETTGGPTFQVINFSVVDGNVVFTPTDTFDLVTNPGATTWNGRVDIDVASLVPNATKVQLSLDNNLYAYSEDGTGASVQKKIGSPGVIIGVPEPGTAMMLALGLVGMALARRRSA